MEVGRPLLGAGDGREHVTGDLAGLDSDVLIAVAVEHLDDVRIIRRARPRHCAVKAGGMLKRQGQPCDQIANGERLTGAQCGKPLDLFVRKPRKHRCQSVDHVRPQALEGFRVTRLDVQVEPDHGLPSVNVRTDIDRKGIDIHRASSSSVGHLHTRTRPDSSRATLQRIPTCGPIIRRT